MSEACSICDGKKKGENDVSFIAINQTLNEHQFHFDMFEIYRNAKQR